jgi:hypothetical protein
MRRLILFVLLTLLFTSCNSANQSVQGLYEGDPQDLLLNPEDLPGAYTLMEDLSGNRPNENLMMNSDDPEARDQYLERTKRIAGWENRFMLMEPTQTLPGFILNQVIVYESIDGAQTALTWPMVQTRETVETERVIGDSMILTMMLFNAPDNSVWIDYRVEFVYKNLLGAVSTYAPEAFADLDYTLDLAELLLQRFQDALDK